MKNNMIVIAVLSVGLAFCGSTLVWAKETQETCKHKHSHKHDHKHDHKHSPKHSKESRPEDTTDDNVISGDSAKLSPEAVRESEEGQMKEND